MFERYTCSLQVPLSVFLMVLIIPRDVFAIKLCVESPYVSCLADYKCIGAYVKRTLCMQMGVVSVPVIQVILCWAAPYRNVIACMYTTLRFFMAPPSYVVTILVLQF